ncbi:MAG: winged helix DNA-binding domain-containing protein [Elusimicrobiota bacterium]|jgi:hypothetical protein|nr:winged helix DNA-binding domain-containing protein [Elusimicrobiota bacterium]
MNIINQRLINHRLIKSKIQTPVDVVKWMTVMQSQDFTMALFAIAMRMQDKNIDAALEYFNKGGFLRTHILRPTWHFVCACDILWMSKLSAPQIKARSFARDKSLCINEKVILKCFDVIKLALKNCHLTRDELSQKLADAGININPAFIYHIFLHGEIEGLICSGAMKNKKQTYALLCERAPQAKTLSRENSLETLARRYFLSHGPAMIKDFSWWSGLNVSEARKAINTLDGIKQKDNYFFYPNADINIAKNTYCLLPAFDEYLIAYQYRKNLIDDKYINKAISSNGIFSPVILRDGKAIGTWKIAKKEKSKNFVPSFFGKQKESIKKQLNKLYLSFTSHRP